MFTLKVVMSVLCNIVSHEVHVAQKLARVRNCMIFAQACAEDLIFRLKWLMLMLHFCVSTVSTMEPVINKTKSSFMQIFVYLISFVLGKMFIRTIFGDLLASVIIRSKFGENESLK